MTIQLKSPASKASAGSVANLWAGVEKPSDWLDWVMLFPTRALALAAGARLAQAMTAPDRQGRISVRVDDLRLALSASAHASKDEITAATRKAVVAGALLALLYCMHAEGDTPSMDRAMRDVYAKWALGKSYGDGKPLPYSKQTLQQAWNEFAPVAHFWAASEMSKIKEGPLKTPFTERFKGITRASHADVQTFYGLARAIGEFATTYQRKTKPPGPFVRLEDLVPVPGNAPPIRLVVRTV